jgi:hypothetical protein
MIALPGDLEGRDIEIEARQVLGPCCARGGDQAPMPLLCTSIEVCDGTMRFSTLTQKTLELVPGVRSTGHEVTALQGLQGGSPLA